MFVPKKQMVYGTLFEIVRSYWVFGGDGGAGDG